MKNIFSREVKVGIMAITAISVLYIGLNFLKGIEIFSPSNEFYATYENIGGLVTSSPVFVKGYKVGQVDEIKYDFSKKESFVIRISVIKDIKLPKGTKVELFDDGIMGGKAIQLIYDPITPSQPLYQPNDTIQSQQGKSIMAQVATNLMPKIDNVTNQTELLLRSVRKLVESKELKNSLTSIEQTTADLSVSSSQLKSMMGNEVPRILSNVNVISSDFKLISGNLKKIDYAGTISSIDKTISTIDRTTNKLGVITEKMNSTEGSIGLLLNNKDLYLSLKNTANSADKLLIDLKQNPNRYVQFSLFGSMSK
jgi:phospholipid/cholesterol/gamma-HCH transport system substrate-binding protein